MFQMPYRTPKEYVVDVQGGLRKNKLSYFVHILSKYWPIFTFFFHQ